MKNIRAIFFYSFLASLFSWTPVVYSQPAAKSELLMKEALASVAGKQVTVNRMEVPVGYKAASHSHPGETFVYILSGRILNQIGDAEPVVYEAGQFFFEQANALHARFENADPENASVVLIFGVRPAEGN